MWRGPRDSRLRPFCRGAGAGSTADGALDGLNDPQDGREYTARVLEAAVWVCGILNPRYIALGGPALRRMGR
ncbi:MAG: hypothetical protein ACLRI7_07710 [Ruthenibacterium lactatiformans]